MTFTQQKDEYIADILACEVLRLYITVCTDYTVNNVTWQHEHFKKKMALVCLCSPRRWVSPQDRKHPADVGAEATFVFVWVIRCGADDELSQSYRLHTYNRVRVTGLQYQRLVLLVKNALQWKVDKWDTCKKKRPTGVRAVQKGEKVKRA